MEQTTMKDLIIHCMENMKSSKISTAYLLYIARGVMDSCNLDKIAFSATTEHIFRTVFNNSALFKISFGGDSVELVYPEKLRQYIDESEIDNEVLAAINKYVADFDQPHFPALVCQNFAEERESYILSIIFYIEWVLDMVDKHGEFKSCDYHIAEKSCDLENLTILHDLYRVINIYCEQYLISCNNFETQSYQIVWGSTDDLRAVELNKLEIEGTSVIQAVKCVAGNDAINYLNIAFCQEDRGFRKKKKVLCKVEEVLVDAKSHGLPYKSIKYIIDKIYNIYPNENNF